MSRSCDGCTKCCEGWLATNVEGNAIYKGLPCPFVVLAEGCSRHETRPEDPCRSFYCEYIANLDVPEWLKPDRSGVILMRREVGGLHYLFMVAAGQPISSSTLSWFVTWGLAQYGNVAWETELGSYFYLGTDEFCTLMQGKIAHNKPI